MENWIYYTLQHKESKELVELKGCIDTLTIDDDEPSVEYMNGQGVWASHHPNYTFTSESYYVDGVDKWVEFNELLEFEATEWDIISQIIAECEDTVNGVFKREFEKVNLYVSYDEDFSSEMMTTYPLGYEEVNDYRK